MKTVAGSRFPNARKQKSDTLPIINPPQLAVTQPETGSEESYASIGNEKQNLIHFHDEKGTLRLSIKFSKLYYIEAADNYVNIYYENKGKISRFLLRKSLKSIEDTYKDYPLIRCHRSYIINLEKVKVLKKEKDVTYLDFDYVDINVIPVSKTYSQNIIDIFYK